MKNKKIVIAGGTGFIGQALAAWLGKENEVTVLSRSGTSGRLYASSKTARNKIRYIQWDGLRVEKAWSAAIDGSDMVINLAGKSVNCRYNAANKKEILESRMDSTRAIGLAVRDAVRPPTVWINAASATIYRHAEDRPQDEYTGEYHDDFSVRVCKAWEKTFEEQRTPFTRKVTLRIAITLGKGGALLPYLRLAKLGLGGRQGNGRQMFSWVHIDDLCRIVEWVDEHPSIEGVYNVSSPGAVRNSALMKTIRQATGMPIGLPAPLWMLKIGAALIGTETELIIKSRWVLPTKLLAAGFTFRYEELGTAIRSIVKEMKH